MPKLTLRFLGPPRFECDGIPITLHRRKAIALLAYLAITTQAHSRDALATLFWPELDQSRARSALRRTLSHLNRTPIGDWLIADRQLIRLEEDSKIWIDVAEFNKLLTINQAHDHLPTVVCAVCIEHYVKAVELYSDDLLAGFTLPDSPDFDDWQYFECEKLRRDLASILGTLSSSMAENGKFDTAIAYSQRKLSLDPLEEKTHRSLMRLYALADRRSASLRQFQECQQLLESELGVSPQAETIQLHQQILDGTFESSNVNDIQAYIPAFLSQEQPSSVQVPDIFVARELELDQLNISLTKAIQGEGKVLFVVGEAGSGKTALANAFARHAQTIHPHLIVASGICNAFTGVGDPYLPFRNVLSMLTCQIEDQWLAGAITTAHAERLWQLLPHTVQALVGSGINLVESFMSPETLLALIKAHDRVDHRTVDILEELAINQSAYDGPANQARIFEEYTDVLSEIALQNPLLIIIDDLQWSDTSSLGLFFYLARRISKIPLLLVGIYRPEDIVQDRNGGSHYLKSMLSEFKHQFGDIWLNLDQANLNGGRRFIDALLETEPNRLSEDFHRRLVELTDGNPLFTIELLRDFQGRGLLEHDDTEHWVARPDLKWDALPAKIEGVIEKRMGRLDASLRQALDIACVEGETFTAELVAGVQQTDEMNLVRRISSELDAKHRLVRAREAYRISSQRLSRYQFRHSLFQVYLYQSLDSVQRIWLHEAVGKKLEELYQDRGEEVAVQLANHFSIAGMSLKAVDYLMRAGDRAAKLAAHQEAVVHYRTGLALLEGCPESKESIEWELRFLLALGGALTQLKGFAAPEVGEAFQSAKQLCMKSGMTKTALYARVLQGLWSFYLVRSDYGEALKISKQFLTLADNLIPPDAASLIGAHRTMGISLMFSGELEEAYDHLVTAVSHYDPAIHQHLAFRYIQDPKAVSLVWSSVVLWCLGFPDTALERSLEAREWAEKLDHPYSLVFTMALSCCVLMLRRDPVKTAELAAETMALSGKYQFPFLSGLSKSLYGWSLTQQGQLAEGIQYLLDGIEQYRQTGSRLLIHFHLAMLAEAYLGIQSFNEALAVLDEGLEFAKHTNDLFYVPEVHRLRGEVLLAMGGKQAEAEHHFLSAAELARQQSARSWELRATVSLCKLRQQQHRTEEACAMLAPILGWFKEGRDTPDVIEGFALL